MKPELIHILLIEDNRLLREGIAEILRRQDDMTVTAIDGSQSLPEMLDETHPDIILSDVVCENRDMLKEISACDIVSLNIKLILIDLISIYPDIMRLIETGASGFIVKDATPDEFLSTIRSVYRGEKVLPQPLTDTLFRQIMETALSTKEIEVNNLISLTPREMEVMDLIADGMTNKEIAESLHVATHTVKSHVHNILEKLTLKTRLEIAHFAYQKKTQM
jgi:DNA-binding NarL/FixJ family response regulator